MKKHFLRICILVLLSIYASSGIADLAEPVVNKNASSVSCQNQIADPLDGDGSIILTSDFDEKSEFAPATRGILKNLPYELTVSARRDRLSRHGGYLIIMELKDTMDQSKSFYISGSNAAKFVMNEQIRLNCVVYHKE